MHETVIGSLLIIIFCSAIYNVFYWIRVNSVKHHFRLSISSLVPFVLEKTTLFATLLIFFFTLYIFLSPHK